MVAVAVLGRLNVRGFLCGLPRRGGKGEDGLTLPLAHLQAGLAQVGHEFGHGAQGHPRGDGRGEREAWILESRQRELDSWADG